MARFNQATMDTECLAAVKQGTAATYVLRNRMDWPGRPLHKSGLKTSHVLTACRRLERQGKIKEVPTIYVTMLSWEITET